VRAAARFSIPFALLTSACAARQTPAGSLDATSDDVTPRLWVAVPSKAEVMQRWTLPPDDPWASYCKYTLMASLGETATQGPLPDVETLVAVQRAREAGHRVGDAGLPPHTAWIVDLRGAASVAFGAAVTGSPNAATASLVPTFNNWPAPNEVVPAEETLAALATMTPVAGDDETARIPIFLLDAWRLAHRYDEPGDDAYDNRYVLTSSDLPDAETLRARGFDQVVYLVDSLSDTTVEEDDLNPIFQAYEAAGIRIAMVDLHDILGTPEVDPWGRVLVVRDLWVEPRETILSGPSFYVRARGGFGGIRARPSVIAIGHGGGAWWHGGGG
jgi:hypothetical protein